MIISAKMNNLVLNFVKSSLDELEYQAVRIQRAAFREYLQIETIARESYYLLSNDERLQISEAIGCKINEDQGLMFFQSEKSSDLKIDSPWRLISLKNFLKRSAQNKSLPSQDLYFKYLE